MSELLELGRRTLAAQTFTTMLGVELVAYTEGQAELRLPIRDDFKQHHDFVHGGLLGVLADMGLAFAGGSLLGMAVVTSEYKINFVRPAMGEMLIAKSTVVHAGKNQAVCRCDVLAVRDGSETLCATAQGTITRLSGASTASA